MAKRASRNLECVAGDDYDHQITFVDTDGVTPLDVSSWTFAAKVRRSAGDSAVTAFTIDTTDASSGVIVLSLSGTQTGALAPGSVWDAERTVGGKTLTFLGGSFTTEPQVTY